MAFLTEHQLRLLGFKKLGKNIKVSSKASIYNAANIIIGDFTRIDDFCILSAGNEGMEIGRNVHIACYTSLIGSGLIKVEDFAGISSHCSVYSSTDDFSGDYLTGPTIPKEYTNVASKPVIIKKHVIIGASCTILPGVEIGLCSSVGAHSLVTKDMEAFSLYSGVPAKKIKSRNSKCLELEKEYISKITL